MPLNIFGIGLGFEVQGSRFWFWVSGSGFWFSGFRVWVSGFGFKGLGF